MEVWRCMKCKKLWLDRFIHWRRVRKAHWKRLAFCSNCLKSVEITQYKDKWRAKKPYWQLSQLCCRKLGSGRYLKIWRKIFAWRSDSDSIDLQKLLKTARQFALPIDNSRHFNTFKLVKYVVNKNIHRGKLVNMVFPTFTDKKGHFSIPISQREQKLREKELKGFLPN